MKTHPTQHRRTFRWILSLWLIAASQASAGMTVITLTDMARMRFDALSFFIAAYLFIAWVVKILWNHFATTFPALPRLNYRRALSLVLLSGLLFFVVLTMISGARELLTPGAWEKQGAGYRLRENSVTETDKEDRRAARRRLRTAIWSYAEKHDGEGPGMIDDITPVRSKMIAIPSSEKIRGCVENRRLRGSIGGLLQGSFTEPKNDRCRFVQKTFARQAKDALLNSLLCPCGGSSEVSHLRTLPRS